MTDFATLVLAADTRQMTQAERAIDGVTRAGEGAEKQTDKTGRSIANMDKMARRAAIGAGALVAATIALTRSSMNQIDALAKQAQQVGLLTRDFQAMSLVAEEAGVSTQTLTGQIAFMQRNIVELGRGTELQTRSFRQLNLSLKDLQGLSPDQQFERIAVALSGVEDPAQKTALAMEVFGRSGRAAINMLDGYTDALADARRFQDAFGISIGQDASDAIERANDALGRVSMGFSGLGNILASELAPRLEKFANGMIEAIIQTDAINRVAGVMVAILDRAVFVLGAAAATFGIYRAAAIVSTVATMGFATALGVLRAALVRTGFGIAVVAVGELAFRFDQARRAADDLAGATNTSETAARDLAIELEQMASTDLPNASKATVQLANDNLSLARSAFEAARAQVELAKATQQAAFTQMSVEDAFRPGVVNPGRAALEAANAGLLASVAALTKAEEELNDRVFEGNQIKLQQTEIVKRGAGSIEGLTTETSKSAGQTSVMNEAALVLAETMDNQLTRAVDGVSDAFADLVMRGFSDFRSFTRSILDMFKGMLRDMIATAARNRIMISLGMGGSVAGTAANAAGSGMGGAIAGAGGMAGLGSAALGGAQFVASGFASGGLAGAGSALATAGAGATMGLGGAAAAIGAFALPMAIIAAPLMIFAAASARRARQRMKEIEAQTQKLESETKRKDEETVQRLQANVDATDALIASMQTLAQLEQQREQAARAILSEREGLEVELLRLQNDLVALREREVQALEPVNRQLGRFIFAMKDAAEAINAQRQAVTALAGAGRGIVDFVRGIREQAGASFQADLALARAGDAGASQRLPSSAQAAIDQARATATSGTQFDRFVAQTAASLMALPAVATFEEQQIALLEELNEGVADLNALQDFTQRKLISAINDGFFFLDKNLDGKLTFEELKAGLGGIATDQELRNIFDQLDKNGDGLVDQFENLIGVENVNIKSLFNVLARGFTALDTNLDGKLTFDELQRGLGHIATDAQLRELFKLTDTNGDGTISQLEALGNSNHNIDDNTLENFLASQSQISELKIIAGETANNTQRVANLTTAIENLVFGQRVAAAQQLASLQSQRTAAQTALQTAQASLSQTPSEVVIRKGNFFQRSIKAPNPQFAALQADIRRAQQELAALEAQILQVPAFAAGGMHSGGLRLVGERGPELEATGPSRIYNNGDTMNMLSNAPVVSELKQLRREIASFRDEQRQLGIQTSRNTDRTTRVLREWDVTGLPEVRTL